MALFLAGGWSAGGLSLAKSLASLLSGSDASSGATSGGVKFVFRGGVLRFFLLPFP